MKCLAIEHIDFLKSLIPLCKSKRLFNSKIRGAKIVEINAISELLKNILKGNIHCSKAIKTKLKPYAGLIREIGSRGTTVGKRRNKIRQKGGFLLAALLPTAIGAIVSLIARK